MLRKGNSNRSVSKVIVDKNKIKVRVRDIEKGKSGYYVI